MLADMAIGIETSRLAVQRSAWEVDQVSGVLCMCRPGVCVFPDEFPGVSNTAELERVCSDGIRLIVWIYRGIY